MKGSRAAGFANISNRQVGSYLCLSLLSALTMFPFCLLILWAPLPKLLLHLARDTRRPLHRQHTLLLFLNFDARFFFFKLSTQSSCFLPNWLWFLHLIVQSYQMKLFWIFASIASNYWKCQFYLDTSSVLNQAHSLFLLFKLLFQYELSLQFTIYVTFFTLGFIIHFKIFLINILAQTFSFFYLYCVFIFIKHPHFLQVWVNGLKAGHVEQILNLSSTNSAETLGDPFIISHGRTLSLTVFPILSGNQ